MQKNEKPRKRSIFFKAECLAYPKEPLRVAPTACRQWHKNKQDTEPC